MSEAVPSQESVFAFLQDPATHGGGEVRRIDTHLSAVFLTPRRAYKVKRAVRFPFVDFTTLDSRRRACEAELEVNRRFASGIYIAVRAVTAESGGGFAIDGQGQAVEYMVEMVRFDENRTLDRLADRGEIDAALASTLGETIAAAHAHAPVVEAGPWIAALADYIAQNDAALRERADLFDAVRVGELTAQCRSALERLEPLLARRGARGLVRRGHGDLHLGNIAMRDGMPLPFDAIEFDPLIAAGDIYYDLAFLLMDLVERELGSAANIVFNRYLATVRDPRDLDGLAALPLFMALRAAIRAKVTAARLDNAEPDRHASIGSAARTYFDLAVRLIAPPRPRLVAVGGLSGTGKSVLARGLAPHLAPEPGAVLLRSDVERKAMFGCSETEPLPPQAYAPDVSDRVYAALFERARHVLAAGHSVLVDAVFAKPAERDAVRALTRGSPAQFVGLFLTVDLDTRLARVGGRRGDASDADAAVVRRQEDYALGAIDWLKVDASGTPDETLARALAALGKEGERQP